MANDNVTIDFLGDNKGLDESIKKAEGSIGDFGAAIPIAIGTAMAAVAGSIIGTITDAFKSAFSFAVDIVKESFGLFAVQQEEEKKLAAVIEATGMAAGFTAKQMGEMASGLQQVTKVGDETILGAQAIIATFKNIKGEQFKETTKLALDMATVMGTDVKSASMQVAKALQDPLKGLTMLTRAGVTFTDSQKKMVAGLIKTGDVAGAQNVILEELRGQFGGAAEAVTDGLGGWTQFSNRVGDVKEEIGEGLMPVLDALSPLMGGILNLVEAMMPSFQAWVKQIVSVAEMIGTALGPSLDVAAKESIKFLTSFETTWDKMGDILKLFAIGSSYEIVAFTNDVVYQLTEVIPAHLTWLQENWIGIFKDLSSIQAVIMKNMWTNVSDFFSSIMNLLSGEEADFRFTALEHGFETSLKALPVIAKREMGGLEKTLQEEAGRLATGLASSYSDNLEKNMKLFDFVKDTFTGKNKSNINLDEIIGGDGGAYSETTQAIDKKIKKEKEKKEKEDKGVKGGFESLTALADRISSSAMTKGETEIVKELKNVVQTQVQAASKSFTIQEDQAKAMHEVVAGFSVLTQKLPELGALK